MDIRQITEQFSVSGQLQVDDVATLAAAGVRTIFINRPDGEDSCQPSHDEISRAAELHGLRAHYMPVIQGAVTDAKAAEFSALLKAADAPVHAYSRTGMRPVTLWALAQAADGMAFESIRNTIALTGGDMTELSARLIGSQLGETPVLSYDVVIVGAGTAGLSVASGILRRDRRLSVALIDPADYHYYQPGWTLVGAGVYEPGKTRRRMGSLIPDGVDWIKSAVVKLEPDADQVLIEGFRPVTYRRLVVAAGLKLNWDGIEGLSETLGKNGVTSTYRYDLAPYTWQLVKALQGGRAVFTQPEMPFKCVGAPQKVMYLSSDYWRKQGRLDSVEVQFFNTGPGLFGVKDYVPALMNYVDAYGITLNFHHQLTKVDGPAKKAWFRQVGEGARDEPIEVSFDMLHVCPPQQAPDFVRNSPLSDDAGWVDVDQYTLRHKRFENIYALGDVMNAPNAKSASAIRGQAPVVAHNLVASLQQGTRISQYDGYGNCPLTVERGKTLLAECGYGGRRLPRLPVWLNNGTRPTRTAWLLQERLSPKLYWSVTLKGHDWFTAPTMKDVN